MSGCRHQASEILGGAICVLILVLSGIEVLAQPWKAFALLCFILS